VADAFGGMTQSPEIGTTESTTGQVAGRVQEKAQEVGDQARERTQEMAAQAQGLVRQEVDKRSTQAGERVSSTASDLRSVAEELRNQGKDMPAKLAEQAADRTQTFGSYLKDADGDRILSDIEEVARRQPWAVVAGGVALGFIASRLLKASGAQRWESRQGEGRHTSTRSRADIRSELAATYGGVETGAYREGRDVFPETPVTERPVIATDDPAPPIEPPASSRKL